MAQMRITSGKGVHFILDNGVTLSIQIGGGNYCDNYDEPIGARYENPRYELPPSRTAEIAVWGDGVEMINLGYDTVKGRVPVEEVISFLVFLGGLPSGLGSADLARSVAGFGWKQ